VSDERALYAFRRNIVVAASAGTGKTHRLTALYVLLCLGLTSLGERDDSSAHPPLTPDRIVATTFSRAAALEIRTRIEAALGAIADGSESAPFAAEIAARVATLSDPPSEAEIRRRAARARDTFYDARIDTLHGLAGDILRRHAVALGVRPNLQILTDEELATMSAAIIDETLAEGLEGDEAARGAVHDLVDSCSGFFRAREALLPFFERLDDDGLGVAGLRGSAPLANAMDLFQRLTAGLRAVASDGGMNSAEPAQTAWGEIREAEKRGADVLALSEPAQAALTRLFSLRKPAKPSPGERAFFEFRETVSGKTNAERGETLIATLTLARGLEHREANVLALLARIGLRLAEERRARGAASFGDLLRLARDRLRDRPDVLAEVQREMDVLLVDEFQDTSRVQRDIVYLLRERADARTARPRGALPAADAIAGHGLFVVGDRKQSIYGFRGADVAVFNRVCGELAGRAAGDELGLPDALVGSAPSADFIALRTSYRSAPAIVELVNAFSEADFANASHASADVSVRYGAAEQLISAREGETGRVLFVADDGSPIDEPLLVGAQAPLREAFSAAALASQLCSDGGFAFRDIAILARRRATIPLVELGLARFGLPYVVAGRALFDTLEVRDMAALLRLLLEPADRAALAHTLRGPLVGLSDAALLSLAEDRGLRRDLLKSKESVGLDASTFADEASRLAAFRDRFLAERTALLRLPAADAVRAAIATFDMDRVTAALPRAPSRLGNLDRLQKLARERKEGLFAFSRWLDRQIEDESDEQEAVVFSAEDDAIRLTTIHASKGLDFQATIVLDLAASERANAAPLRFSRIDDEARLVLPLRGPRGLRLDSAVARAANQEARQKARAERSRISYVAITRARRVLGLIGSTKDRAAGSWLETFAGAREKLDPLIERLDAATLIGAALARGSDTVAPQNAIADHPREFSVSPLPSAIAIATTPLGVFAGCPRRFRLRFLLGLEEPIDTGQLDLFELDPERTQRKIEPFESESGESDPRVAGRAAHRVLERTPLAAFGERPDEGALARALVAEEIGEAEAAALAPRVASFIASRYAATLKKAAAVLREHELLLAAGEAAPRLWLRGTVDLAACFDETVDVIDYKLARAGDMQGYAFQLRAYGLALAKQWQRPVRAGIVFLGSGGEPQWLPGSDGSDTLTADDHAATERELLDLARRFAESRQADEFPGVPVHTCHRLHCGFVGACHPESKVSVKQVRRRRGPR
jgi:ATP-dependent helicase/nuclease subunit A